MNKTSLKVLETERHDVTVLRVTHLESLLERALELIDRYVESTWVDDAFSQFFAETEDKELSQQCARTAWESEQGKTTAMFGYPIPPEMAEDAVAGELSYWGEE